MNLFNIYINNGDVEKANEVSCFFILSLISKEKQTFFQIHDKYFKEDVRLRVTENIKHAFKTENYSTIERVINIIKRNPVGREKLLGYGYSKAILYSSKID